MRANPVRGADGDVVALRERHPRRHAASAPPTSRARDRPLSSTASSGTRPVGLAFWDTELSYVRVNDELVAIYGLPPEEILGRNVFDVFPALRGPDRRAADDGRSPARPVLGLEVVGETPRRAGRHARLEHELLPGSRRRRRASRRRRDHRRDHRGAARERARALPRPRQRDAERDARRRAARSARSRTSPSRVRRPRDGRPLRRRRPPLRRRAPRRSRRRPS